MHDIPYEIDNICKPGNERRQKSDTRRWGEESPGRWNLVQLLNFGIYLACYQCRCKMDEVFSLAKSGKQIGLWHQNLENIKLMLDNQHEQIQWMKILMSPIFKVQICTRRWKLRKSKERTNNPQIEKHNPKVILYCRRVFRVKGENVSDNDDGSEKKKYF